MRRSKGSWWWAQIVRVLVYFALGVLSAGFAVLIGGRYLQWVRMVMAIMTWILVMLLIDIQVQAELVT